MHERRLGQTAWKLLLAAMMFRLAACASGVTGPCDDSDPVGPCATSHSQVRGG